MRTVWNAIGNNWQLKLTAFGIACVLWLAVQSGKPYLYRMPRVPVTVQNRSADWVVSAPPSPAAVTVEFRAPFRELLHVSDAHPSLVIPVDSVSDTAATYVLRAGWVSPSMQSDAITVGRIFPDTVRVSFDHVATRLVALRAKFRGRLADGFTVGGPPVIDPAVVRVSGPARRLAKMDTLDLPTIDVSGLRGDDTIQMNIDTTGMQAVVTPVHVRVVVPVRRDVYNPAMVGHE